MRDSRPSSYRFRYPAPLPGQGAIYPTAPLPSGLTTSPSRRPMGRPTSACGGGSGGAASGVPGNLLLHGIRS
ncbi:hypothetical protein ACU635_44250 [[Actinomadura] parvosata]|uniref:hypothetical protein n=1 Tax=[Actinomadura] parvosata TaxID=1955412 RepID=UPI00406BFD46